MHTLKKKKDSEDEENYIFIFLGIFPVIPEDFTLNKQKLEETLISLISFSSINTFTDHIKLRTNNIYNI